MKYYKDLERFERGVLRLCPVIPNQHSFLIVSFHSLTILAWETFKSPHSEKHNRGDYPVG